ncbi:insecticidal delta-endotoxin Cry8Ea1 family protein [Bacillus mycoides]|uniref:insecticidal delta-endotoxin Cry8Ea1 family protein n=1 Tax=Bacillus mycoides TaxID=1405 RepID=UPI003D00E78F
MNHNKDNNEYEIIDSHASPYPSNRNNNYSRYPYTNNPNQPLSNTNYKDWLTMCQGNQQYGKNPQTLVDAGAALSTGTIILGTLLTGFATTVVPGIALISFGTLLPLLWPSGETDKTVWIQFMNYGGSIFQPMLDTEINRAALILQGLQSVLNNYQNGIDYWLKIRGNHIPGTPPSPELRQAADTAKGRLETAHAAFLSRMPELQLEEFKVAILPSYTQAASLHLNLLSQGVQFADQLNADMLNQPTEDAGTSDGYHELLLGKITQYVNYCIATYQEGLTILKNSPGIRWNIYNTYRRDMTRLVLDFIAVFPNFDIRQYPTGTHSELTREIYTDALMREYPGGSPIPIAQREKELTRTPHLFTRLNKFTLFTTRNNLPPALHAVQNFFSYTNDNFSNPSPIYKPENFPEPNTDSNGFDIANTNVTSIELTRWRDYYVTTAIIFNTLDGIKRQYNSGFTHENSEIINFIFPEFPAGKIPPYGLGIKYTHILSYIKIGPEISVASPSERQLSFAWTHTSVNFNNTISNKITTQIPAVKARNLPLPSFVMPGPGHTGGDLVVLTGNMEFQCVIPTPTKYAIRIRYAAYSSDSSINLTLNIVGGGRSYFLRILNIGSTVTAEKDTLNPKYHDFKYSDFLNEDNTIGIVDLSSTTNMTFRSNALSGNTLIIDKIEFIPITQTFKQNFEKQKLEKIQQTVNTLFTDHTKNTLKVETTDYEIDQTTIQIESLSEELYPQEKMIFLDTMKQAKQRSQSRNLLQNGDFQSFIGWTTNNDLTIQTANPIFKGSYLHIPGARTTKIDNTIFPTYVYQKIDESKLKPYTRYVVRGCISNSKDLELFVTRYDKEVHTILNVPNNLSHMYFDTPSDPCDPTRISSNCENENAFSFSIDTGNLDFHENLGIGILFKISNPDGYAALGNLEVIEEQPLTEEEVNRVTEKENRWRQTRNHQQKETEKAYYQARQAIDTLFVNSQCQMLKIETTIQDIVMAETFIDKIPYIYNEWLPNESGINHNMFMKLKNLILQAYSLYDVRNIIQNGNFINGINNWSTSSDTRVEQINNASILVIPNWNTQVSQHINVSRQNHPYLLRVIAKKEGIGNGYVKISDCTKHVKTLTFTSSDSNYNTMWDESIGYVTKTMHITPHTNQVRIDIGETGGTFNIKSVELVCIKN